MSQQFTTSESVFQWMDEGCTRAIQPGLERMEWLLEHLNHPERRCKFIHIAGTNGKGSVSCKRGCIVQHHIVALTVELQAKLAVQERIAL